MPEPEAGPNDVLVRIKAAAVNLIDAKIRDGAFKLFRPYFMPLKLGLFLRRVMAMLGRGVLKKAKARGGSCSFLFMQADGGQLAQRAGLIDAGVIRPVVDRVLPFDQTPEALAPVETGRGKVVD